MGLREVMLAGVVPGVVGFVVLLGVVLVGWKKGGWKPPPLGWPSVLSGVVVLLMAGGAVLGSYAWQTRVELWSGQATHRFPFVALVAGGVGLIVAFMGRRWRWVGVAAPSVGGGVVAWVFLSLLHESLISEVARWGWVVGVALVVGMQALVLERVPARLAGWRGAAVLSVMAGLVAVGAMEAFVNGALVLGPVAAVLGALGVVGLIRPGMQMGGGVGAALAVLMAGVAVFANWFGDHERWVMLGFLTAVPMGAGLCLVPWVARRGVNVRFAAAVVGVVVLGGIQAGRAIGPLVESMSPAVASVVTSPQRIVSTAGRFSALYIGVHDGGKGCGSGCERGVGCAGCFVVSGGFCGRVPVEE